jgi:hypothetical protein
MVKSFILLALLTAVAYSDCSLGCLACQGTSQCRLCDPYSGFHINGTACLKTSVLGCQSVDEAGKCLTCLGANFFLDPSTKLCVLMETTKIVPWCLTHNADATCALCQSDYYLATPTSCVQINSPIKNCAAHKTSTACQTCAAGYQLSKDMASCSVPATKDCALLSRFKCQTCPLDKFPRKALYLLHAKASNYDAAYLARILGAATQTGFSALPMPSCYEVQDCLQYNPSDYSCVRCAAGYSLNPAINACFKNPLPRTVPNCKVYSAPTECLTCDEGYALTPQRTCMFFPGITLCSTYNFVAETVICSSCKEAAYLRSTGACVPRLNYTISHCSQYVEQADGCQVCEAGFVRSSDYLLCLPVVANCATYVPFTSISIAAICETCVAGFYQKDVSRTQCIKGTVTACNLYQPVTGYCSSCTSPYVLNTIDPVPICSIPIQYCVRPDGLTKCIACDSAHTLSTSKQFCLTPVPNCKTHSETTASPPELLCEECNPLFYIENSLKKSCILGTITNCVDYALNEPKCDVCATNFRLTDDKLKCLASITGCKTYEPSDTSSTQHVCSVCQDLYYLTDSTGLTCTAGAIAHCTKYKPSIPECATCNTTFHATDNNKACLAEITNCTTYTPTAVDTTVLTCDVCAATFYLKDNTKLVCVAGTVDHCATYKDYATQKCLTCDTDYKLTTDGAICLKVIPHCQIYVDSTSADTFLKCLTCVTGFEKTTDKGACLAIVPSCATYVDSVRNQTELFCKTCAATFQVLDGGKTCLAYIANCKTYVSLAATVTALTCADCLATHYLKDNTKKECLLGTVVNCIDFVDYTGKCQTCETGYQKFLAEYACTPNNIVTNCKTYSTGGVCTACDDGFSVGTGGGACNAVVIPNCAEYSGTACKKCAQKFKFSGTNCVAVAEEELFNCDAATIPGLLKSDTLNLGLCQQCASGFAPSEFKNAQVCRLAASAVTDNGGAALSADCVAWKLVPGATSLTCVKCATGKLLEGGACVAACSTGTPQKYGATISTMTVAGKFSAGLDLLTNTCGAKTVNNCAVMTPLLNQPGTTPVYGCATCSATFLTFVTLTAESTLKDGATTSSQVTPTRQCLVSSTTVLGAPASDANGACAYYFDDAAYGKKLCIGCEFGKTGPIVAGITNCAVYNADPTLCDQCMVGYHPGVNFGSCVARTNIDGCAYFDLKSTDNICIQCTLSTHFITGSGTAAACTARTYTNSKCTTYHESADQCIVCATTHTLILGKCILTTDKEALTNCIQFGLTAAFAVKCLACDPATSYISKAAEPWSCTAVTTISSCAIYSQTEANVCLKCDTGKFLSNNRCFDAVPTAGTNGLCEDTTCALCWHTALKLTQTKKCYLPPATTIPDCITYISLTTCGKCAVGKYLTSATACATIPADTNCSEYVPVDINGDQVITADDYDSTQSFVYTCNVCKSGYFYQNLTKTITWNGAEESVPYAICTTKAFHAASISGCTVPTSSTTLATTFCPNGCDAGKIPISFDGLRICVPATFYNNNGIRKTITNCALFGKPASGTDYTCLQCLPGFGLENINGVAQCSAICSVVGSFIARYSVASLSGSTGGEYRVNGRWVCVQLSAQQAPPIPSYCRIVTPQFAMPAIVADLLYVCVKCRSGYTPLTSMDPTSGNSFASVNVYSPTDFSESLDIPISSPFMFYNEIKECFETSVVTSGIVTGNIDNNCMYYGKFINGASSTEYTCNRCKDKYVGQIRKRTPPSDKVTAMVSCNSDSSAGNFNITGFPQPKKVTDIFGSISSLFSIQTPASINSPNVPVAFVGVQTSGTLKLMGWVAWSIINLSAGNSNDAKSLNYFSTNGGADNNPNILMINPSTGFSPNYINSASFRNNMIVSNCAFYAINVLVPVRASMTSGNVDLIDPSTIGTRPLLCLACKPGFTPAFNTGDKKFIDDCVPIVYCETDPGTWVNACTKYAPILLKSDQSYDFSSKGTSIVISNCLIGEGTTTCLVCNPGYVRSKSGSRCDLMTPLNGCTNWEINDRLAEALSNQDSEWLITTPDNAMIPYLQENSFGGCSKCDANYVQVIADRAFDSSINPEWCVDDKEDTASKTNYTTVANCVAYNFLLGSTSTTSVVCTACAADYILTKVSSTSFACILLTDIASNKKTNCALWDHVNSLCLKCPDYSYLMFKGTCLLWGAAQLTAAKCDAWDLTLSSTQGAMRCQTCSDGYYPVNGVCTVIPSSVLTATPNCVQSDGTVCTACKRGWVLATVATAKICLDFSSGTDYKLDGNCKSMSATSFDNLEINCSTCDATYFVVTPTSPASTYCFEHPTLVSAYQTNNCAQFGTTTKFSEASSDCLKCKDSSGFYLASKACSARAAVTDCSYFTQTADTCNYCIATKVLSSNTCIAPTPVHTNAATPTLPAKTFPTNIMGRVETCTAAVTGCVPTTIYNGLGAPWAALFSCHACSTGIPFVFVHGTTASFTAVKGLYSWGSDDNNQALSSLDGGIALKCLTPAATSFHATALTSKFNFPANCALGAVNVFSALDASDASKATGVDRTKIAVMCVACKPAFKPASAIDTLGVTVNGMVSSCTAIANCASSTTFGACDLCDTGNVFQLDANGKVDYTVCVATALANCKILAADATCFLCEAGYFLNLDKNCDKVSLPKCSDTSFSLKALPANFNVIDALFLAPVSGCQTCETGYSPVRYAASTLRCQALTPAARATSGSKYTDNCALYLKAIDGTDNVLCGKCADTYVLSAAKTCLAGTNLANCALAADASTCTTCVAEALMVNGACVLKSTIAHCATFNEAVTTALTCTACEDTYYLKNNACTLGTISNCVVYTSDTVCSRCKKDFGIRHKPDGSTTCLKLPTTFHCDVVKASSFDAFTMTCATCALAADLKTTSLDTDYCVQMASVTHCATYKTGASLTASAWTCLTCDATYTLNTATDTCTAPAARLLFSSPSLSDFHDPIRSLPAGRLLQAVAMAEQPAGIVGCASYTPSLVCLECEPSFYFDGSVCKTLDAESVVPNCIAYNAQQKCARCAEGYYVSNSLCVRQLGENCFQVDPATTQCLSCPFGYGLTQVKEVLTCVKLTGVNCVAWSENSPFACTLCDTGFFLVDGVCTTLTKTVPFCRYYSADGVCYACQGSYILQGNTCVGDPGQDGTSYRDPKCESFAFSESGFCVLCSPGFTLQNGACVSCGGSPGCLICDPDSSTTCAVCQVGYTMVVSGKCVLNTLLTQSTTTNTDTTNGTNGTIKQLHGSILSVLSAVLLILPLLRAH